MDIDKHLMSEETDKSKKQTDKKQLIAQKIRELRAKEDEVGQDLNAILSSFDSYDARNFKSLVKDVNKSFDKIIKAVAGIRV